MRFGEGQFVRGALLAAAIGALASLPWLLSDDRLTARWAALGYLAMAIPGLASGLWLAREHGRRTSRFVLAAGSGFMARLVLAAAATFFAARAGAPAIHGLLPGLVAGFVPVMGFEMAWFARAAAPDARGETR